MLNKKYTSLQHISSIKIFLKQIKFLLKINAKIKCFLIKRRYSKIVAFYEKKSNEINFNELLERRGFNNDWSEAFKNRRPKVFYLGTDEFQDYSGFIQSLSKISDVEVFRKKDGTYGQYKYSTKSAELNSNRLIELLDTLDYEPDILLMQTWAWRLHPNTLSLIKKKYQGIRIINISMDDRHCFYDNGDPSKGVFALIPYLDLSLTAAPEAVDWYLKEKIPALYFPEASCSEIFYPIKTKKKYDVGFIGGKYGIRENLIKKLVEKNINVKCYGNGWSDGRLPINKTNQFYNECKIVLGVGTIGHCEDFFSLKLRDFDVPLSGSCYVTHANEDLINLFGENSITYCTSISDYVEKIQFLLKNPQERKRRALNAYDKAINYHLYSHRLESLWKILNIPIRWEDY